MVGTVIGVVVGVLSTLLATHFRHKYELAKVRFDIKVNILRELWKTLFDLHHAAINLRPVGNSYDPNEPEEERQIRRLQKYHEAAQACWKVIRHNKPFYPRMIHDIADELLQKALREALEFDITSPHPNVRSYTEAYWENATKNIASIKQIVDKEEIAIRRELEGQII